MVSHKMYCVKCKASKACKDVSLQKDVRGKPRMCGKCTACGCKCFQYVSAQKAKSLGSLKSKSKSKSRGKKSKSKGKKKSKSRSKGKSRK